MDGWRRTEDNILRQRPKVKRYKANNCSCVVTFLKGFFCVHNLNNGIVLVLQYNYLLLCNACVALLTIAQQNQIFTAGICMDETMLEYDRHKIQSIVQYLDAIWLHMFPQAQFVQLVGVGYPVVPNNRVGQGEDLTSVAGVSQSFRIPKTKQ